MKKGLFNKISVSASRKVIVSLLALVLVLNLSPVMASDELQSQINEKKQEMSQVSKQINELRSYIDSKQKELNTLKGQLDVINSRVSLIQLQIHANQIEIEKNNAEIEKTEKEILEKEEEIAKQKEMIGTVIKELYKEKDSTILSVIVGANTFSELIQKTEYLTSIRAKLKDTLEKLGILKAELESQKEELGKKKEDLENLKKEKEFEEKNLEEQKYTQVKIVEMTRGEEAAFQSRLAQAQAEEQAISNTIIMLVQEQARRQRSEGVAGREGRDVVSSGDFVYPLSGTNRISITGGDFMDPAYGMGFPHRGVDLRAGQGTSVMSIGVGRVVAAYDSGGVGLSYIAIDHGNGIISKYLHMSAIYVVAGDIVNPGEVIGLSGGTPGTRGAGAFTTGAHLHFELNDYNGNALNPNNYFTFAPPLY